MHNGARVACIAEEKRIGLYTLAGPGAGYLLQQDALLCAETQILVICVICGRAAGSVNLKPPSRRGSACCK